MKTENPTFVLTEDTGNIWKTFAGGSNGEMPGADKYFVSLVEILKQGLIKNDIDLTPYGELVMENALSQRVQKFLAGNANSLCICLDRYLLRSIEDNRELSDKFFRLGICRTIRGERTARQASPQIDKQIALLDRRFPDITKRDILLVDDGIFSGGTAITVANLLAQTGVKREQLTVLGFIGNSANQELVAQGISTSTIVEATNLYDWVDMRDFGVFGGKILNKSRLGKIASSVPYLYPWSQGEGASFDKFGNLFEVSYAIIKAQTMLFASWEKQLGRKIVFDDLLRAGFPFPTDIGKKIPVFRNQRVIDYLGYCVDFLEREGQREVLIFDMDGTLYQLDGPKGGYSGSTLECIVLENTINFISSFEQCPESDARMIMAEGLKDEIGLSEFLAKRYGITRSQYFSCTWNINPEGIIQNFDIPVQTIKKLYTGGKKLVLLTSAPKIWQERVTEFLGLRECFESVYAGESFGLKKEILAMLASRYQPSKMCSIGDQMKSEIEPALRLGMNAMLINSPNDLERLTI